MTVDPISSGLVRTAAVSASSPTRTSGPAPAAAPAPAASPAATVALSGRPASVDADDQAGYAQALRAARGNVNLALASVASQDKESGES